MLNLLLDSVEWTQISDLQASKRRVNPKDYFPAKRQSFPVLSGSSLMCTRALGMKAHDIRILLAARDRNIDHPSLELSLDFLRPGAAPKPTRERPRAP
jgi:hypothetical protein